MYDIDFIQRIFHLTCSEADLEMSHSDIHYDLDHPFEKYYRYSQIKRAIGYYLDGVWTDRMLAHWACQYLWILLGGCEHDNLKEDLDSLGLFLRDTITDTLDVLSFFDEELADDAKGELEAMLVCFESLDYCYRTQQMWRAVYAPVGKYALANGTQYVLLINDEKKEYMIVPSDDLINGYEDEHFSYIFPSELLSTFNRLGEDGYRLYSFGEEDLLMEIKE